ncbi:tRNA pseudouridine synthase B [Campylobacterota bacterium]|nr:tRNA pseudouridine synthase B [Campylobacterota bacterium]
MAYKPLFISSNLFLQQLKRKYGARSGGFSGTLDPFAKGCLIVAFGQYTKLFRFLAKTPKRYRATLWLGAESCTLDLEKITRIERVQRQEIGAINDAFAAQTGEIWQVPPKYSALRIDGQRSYKLALSGADYELQKRTITVHSLEMISYAHPFITFECSVSEGCYVRSIGRDIAAHLGVSGSLSFLERINEGRLVFDHEKPLNPIGFIDLPRNRYFGDDNDILNGKKAILDGLENRSDGVYLIKCSDFFAIISIENCRIKYLQGHLPCPTNEQD